MKTVHAMMTLLAASTLLAACSRPASAPMPAIKGPLQGLGAQSANRTPAEPSFMLMTLPDTQYYAESWPVHFNNQTQWLADHANKLNVKLTTHLGDIVNVPISFRQWDRADAAMSILEKAKVPYSILAGNHDIILSLFDDMNRIKGGEEYLKRFTPKRAALNSTFGGRDSTGWNEYHTFKAAGQTFVVLALNWRVSEQTIAWAKSVMSRYPNSPVILTTHDLVGYTDGKLGLSGNGEYLWDKLVKDNNQIFLTLNGHDYKGKHFNDDVSGARVSRNNSAGNRVDMLLIDYQNGYQGGQGYMSALEFDLARNRIELMTFSPSLAKGVGLRPDAENPVEMTQDDMHYFLNVNFKRRFADFAPQFPRIVRPRAVALTDQVRAALR